MENFNIKQYRDDLAEEIKDEEDKVKRKDILESAKETENYQVIRGCKRIISEAKEEIEKKGRSIGEGKAAIVHITEEHMQDVKGCLKTIRDKKASCNNVEREFYLLKKIYDLGLPVPKPILFDSDEDGEDHIVMEAIEGFALKDLIEGRLEDEEVLEGFDYEIFFEELQQVMVDMHRHQYYHRDLHAGNIMVDKNKKPVIIDFGDATYNHLSNTDPYVVDVEYLQKRTRYPSDEQSILKARRETGLYLKEIGFLNKKRRD